MPVRVVIGYDGSPAASAAIDTGALLFPDAHAWVTHLWMPPLASEALRHRLRVKARDVNEFMDMVEQEGHREAERLVARGVVLARAAGWDAQPLVKRTWGAEGLRLAQVTEQVEADLALVGSRGLGGTRAVLGSVSDMVVHYTARPVVVIPHPLLAADYAMLPNGPALVGWDGSSGAQTALAAASRLFPGRDVLRVSVEEEDGAPLPAPGQAARAIPTLHVERAGGIHARAISDALITCANEHNAAVLVVGSRRQSVAKETLLGSVALATLHHAHRPVMVVPLEQSAGSSVPLVSDLRL